VGFKTARVGELECGGIGGKKVERSGGDVSVEWADGFWD
jgi:hypothetical protein